MSDAPARKGRRGGGRSGRQAARATKAETAAWLERRLAPVDLIDDEAYATIEANADIILEEIGVAFQDFPSALELWRDAGADVRGDIVHFPKGMCRQLVQDNAPKVFTQHARNSERSVQIGGNATVFGVSASAHDLDAC